jgi:hypothetical protein
MRQGTGGARCVTGGAMLVARGELATERRGGRGWAFQTCAGTRRLVALALQQASVLTGAEQEEHNACAVRVVNRRACAGRRLSQKGAGTRARAQGTGAGTRR